MIDEVLPQGPVTGTPEDGDFTKDLSSILKNLKRVEQGLDGLYYFNDLLVNVKLYLVIFVWFIENVHGMKRNVPTVISKNPSVVDKIHMQNIKIKHFISYTFNLYIYLILASQKTLKIY